MHDGDTMTLKTEFRDFEFPLRLLNVDTRELNEGGEDARDFVKGLVEGVDVFVRIDRDNRVGKYGRLLGDVVVGGLSLGESLVRLGFAVPFDERNQGKLPDLNKDLRLNQWY